MQEIEERSSVMRENCRKSRGGGEWMRGKCQVDRNWEVNVPCFALEEHSQSH